jgi:hypothetical protein
MQLPIKHKLTDRLSTNPSAQTTQLTVQENIDFLTKLYLKVPALSFEAVEHHYPAAGHAEAHEFEVFHGIDSVGRVNFRYRRNKDGATVWATSVRSPHIRKDRAPRNEFVSTNNATALRKAIEVFELGPNEQLVRNYVIHDADQKLHSIFNNAAYKARRPFSGMVDSDAIEMAQYFIDKIELPDANIPLPKFAASINTDANKEVLNNYHVLKGLADSIVKKTGYAVRIERDESVRAFPLDTSKETIHAKSTYELPEWMQSKFAMLKMLDGIQGVAQVGIRLTRKDDRDVAPLFFIVDGEMTFTH